MSAAVAGAALVLTGCSTVEPLPGAVAPNTEVLKSWTQGRERNCVTIACIKAAQAIFPELQGTNGVFDSVVRDPAGGARIHMRDGFVVDLSKEELRLAERHSGFLIWRGSSARDPVLFYAASAKRAMLEGNDGHAAGTMTFEQALETLNDGESVLENEGMQRLGLSGLTKFIALEDAGKYSAVVVANGEHAWFVSGGWGDVYGRPRPVLEDGTVTIALALTAPSP